VSVGTHAARTEPWTFRPQRVRASLATWRGQLWAVVVALDFYLLSNPLVYEPVFGVSLQRAVLITAIAVVVSIPWLRVPRPNPALMAFFAWGLASTVWSIQPGATMAAFGLYLTLAALAVMTCANVTGDVLALGFVYGGLLVTVLSVYSFHERRPGSYFETLDVAESIVFAGVGTNPNILAYTVTLGIAGWLALWPRRPVTVVLWLAAGAGLLGAVYLAESTTGYLTAAAMIATAAAQWVLFRLRGSTWTRRRRGLGILLVGATAIAGAAAVGFSGRGPGTFSDRLPFWEATLAVAADRPVVGFGWGSVWSHPWLLAPPNAVADRIYAATGLGLTHGHNSFVDLVVDLGAVGVLLILAIVASVVWTATRRSMTTPHTTRAALGDDLVRSRFVILCVVDLLVFGITEPMLVIPIGFWALVLLTEPPARATRSVDA
jgi:O-antigen ligase